MASFETIEMTTQTNPTETIPVGTFQMDDATELIGDQQDYVFTHAYPSQNKWILCVFDTHGRNSPTDRGNFCLDVLRQIPREQMLEHLEKCIDSVDDNPVLSLQQALVQACIAEKKSMHCGSTLSLVKIHTDSAYVYVDVITSGDSPVHIHENGKCVFQSVIHGTDNVEELQRLLRENRVHPYRPFRSSREFEILSPKHICMVPSKYYDFYNMKLAMSQALGHITYLPLLENNIKDPLGKTGFAPSKHHLVFDLASSLNVKVFSDGVSDILMHDAASHDAASHDAASQDAAFMTTSNATETVKFAVARWKQDWIYCNKWEWEKENTRVRYTMVQDMRDSMDDVCCACWINNR